MMVTVSIGIKSVLVMRLATLQVEFKGQKGGKNGAGQENCLKEALCKDGKRHKKKKNTEEIIVNHNYQGMEVYCCHVIEVNIQSVSHFNISLLL